MKPMIHAYGDTAVRAAFPPETAAADVRMLTQLLQKHRPRGVREWVPAFHAVTIFYDPLESDPDTLADDINQLLQAQQETESSQGVCWELPVCYGGSYGVDLTDAAAKLELTEEELISRHTAPVYAVRMLGFMPGFPYLEGMDESLTLSRHAKPRREVPSGSVGIAGSQTGIYPLASPGGWQLIGRTPVRLYDNRREPPVLLEAGDTVVFKPVSEDVYTRICEQIEAGAYEYRKGARQP
ncbi:5-oxoprolinase subunit PxpB [Alkalicoccus luteus]|uniref:5-oxoprolinase subunit PxpB n=1 Tax=Alkalicoccus luteus TaxID=1237094 RepID=A0A969TVE9_9BACI|nr:5-oxoprolinase subunit PxpB [Alkalicoccus luteus]NJP38335.1 5-oxoprolinase subunit PxpB [Alkalicoccus luteus]